MARDWSNEPWRKLYTRDEPEWLMLSWQARGLFYELLKRVDRAGVMTLGRAGRIAIAAALSSSWDDDLSSAITELENDGSIVFLDSETQLFVPNFAKAQCASTSNAERQRRKREKRSISLDELSAEKHSCHEKKRHAMTRDDTRRHVETRKEEKRREEKRRDKKRGGVGEGAPNGAPIFDPGLGDNPDRPTLAPSLPLMAVFGAEGAEVPDETAKPVKAQPGAGKDMSEKVQRVWNYYLAGWGKQFKRGNPPVLTEVRKRKIRARFKEGFSEEDLTRACDGLWGHRWHLENGQTSPDLLFRDAKHVEQFRGYLEAPNGGNGANKVQPLDGCDVSKWGIEYGGEE